jgi:agmatinase
MVLFLVSELAARAARGESWDRTVRTIVSRLPRKVYLSVDIDGLDPTLCPHTGTPVPGGLSYRQATHLIREIGSSGRKIVGGDLSEVSPGPEGDEWDANVAARLLYKMIGFSVLSHGRL